MPLARYKDLCIDASDAHALTEFWAALLGWEGHPHDDGNGCIRVGDQVRIWVNQVPEATTVKNRLHLDVNAESLAAALAAGATVDEEQPRWTVMKDPDGQVFCVFERDGEVTDRFYELVWDVTGDVDAAHRVAQWWAVVLGGNAIRDTGWSYVADIPGLPFESIVFQPVPEEKTTKNRIHVDITTDDLAALVSAGAMPWHENDADATGLTGPTGSTVMVDPAGNEFCAVKPD